MGAFDKRAYYDDIAAEYAAHVVSPYELGCGMPLGDDLEAWFAADAAARAALEASTMGASSPCARVAVDFGCGTGQSLEMLAGRAALTLGLDYSVGMLREAGRRLEGRELANFDPQVLDSESATRVLEQGGAASKIGRTCLVRGDLHELGWLRGKVDLAVASNSLTDETLERSEHMFSQVVACLRPGAELFALLPSLDATEYLFELHYAYDGELPEGLGELDAEGVYIYEGLRQKFWSPEELRELCPRLGLELLSLSKIHFAWAAMKEAGWGDFEGEEPMWDWYLHARRAPG